MIKSFMSQSRQQRAKIKIHFYIHNSTRAWPEFHSIALGTWVAIVVIFSRNIGCGKRKWKRFYQERTIRRSQELMDGRQRRRLEKRLDMSRHEGVSCDACMKSNFKGRRMKCLRCYDYDLCANCHELGAATSRHTPDHPVQCILSRTDFDLYYSGETNPELAYSLTCPVCGKLGLTEGELQTHAVSEHQNCTTEVVCPICASIPGGEPNLVTDDFINHLTLEHRHQHRETDSALTRQNARRLQQPSRTLGVGRGRRPNMHFNSGGLSPGPRDSVDPIAELLSQLSGVRRAAAVPYDRLLHTRHSASSQAQASAAAAAAALGSSAARRSGYPPAPSNQAILLSEAAGVLQQANLSDVPLIRNEKQKFLLDRCLEAQRKKDTDPDQSIFLQDLILATMVEHQLNLD